MAKISQLVLFILLSHSFLYANIYKSYYPLETDTVLVMWLIKTHVDKNAKFVVVKKNQTILDNENAINTANSKYKRNAQFSAYEVAKRSFKVDNKCSNNLIKISRILEVVPWKKHEFNDIVEFERQFIKLFPQNIGDIDLTDAFTYIDNYCKGKR